MTPLTVANLINQLINEYPNLEYDDIEQIAVTAVDLAEHGTPLTEAVDLARKQI